MKKTDPPIIVEQSFNASPSDVWNAITVRDKMVQWFFNNIEAFEPTIGFETQFNVQVEDRNFLHQWRITEVIPMKKITYHWAYEAYSGAALVSFELFPEGDQTKLRLTNVVLESFPQDIPEFTRESCIGGWNYFIGQNLKEYLHTKR